MKFISKPFFLLFVLFTGTLFAGTPQRIVSLTPCATDILSELGATQQLVGITRYCKAPAGSNPRIIGGLVDPSAETILTLKPDLLIYPDARDKSFPERMAKYGIPYVTLFPESYENIKRDVVLLGEKTKRLRQAEAILSEWNATEELIRKSLEEKPFPQAPRVLILWGEVCAGERSYLNDAILLCGGVNATPAETARAWPILSKEQLIATRTELLIYVTPDGPNALTPTPELADSLKKNPAFALLPAVRTRKIFRLNENSRLLYPTPALRRALPQLADAIRRCALNSRGE